MPFSRTAICPILQNLLGCDVGSPNFGLAVGDRSLLANTTYGSIGASQSLATAVRAGKKTICQIAQISDKRWGAAAGDEVALGVHGVFPLPLGMERYGKGGQM